MGETLQKFLFFWMSTRFLLGPLLLVKTLVQTERKRTAADVRTSVTVFFRFSKKLSQNYSPWWRCCFGGPGASDPAAIDPEEEEREEQVMGNWIVLASRAFQHGRRDLNNWYLLNTHNRPRKTLSFRLNDSSYSIHYSEGPRGWLSCVCIYTVVGITGSCYPTVRETRSKILSFFFSSPKKEENLFYYFISFLSFWFICLFSLYWKRRRVTWGWRDFSTKNPVQSGPGLLKDLETRQMGLHTRGRTHQEFSMSARF
jgi:hypothetical protein